MRKKYLIIVASLLLLMILALLTTWITNPEIYGKKSGKIVIVATIYPIADMIKNIGGNKVKIYTIVPDGQSPHTFIPSNSTQSMIRHADFVFRIGFGLEKWLEIPTASPTPITITLSDGIEPIVPALPAKINTASITEKIQDTKLTEISKNLEPTEDEMIDEYSINPSKIMTMQGSAPSQNINANPHTWLDPNNAIHMCELITDALSSYDPDNRDYYEANFLKYQVELKKLDQTIIQTLSNYSHRRYIPMHAAWDYFDRRYITQRIIAIEDPAGEKPNITRQKSIYDAIELNSVKVIFSEPQFDPAPAKNIATQTKIKLEILDPLGSSNHKDRNSYLKMMYYNLNKMKLAFY